MPEKTYYTCDMCEESEEQNDKSVSNNYEAVTELNGKENLRLIIRAARERKNGDYTVIAYLCEKHLREMVGRVFAKGGK